MTLLPAKPVTLHLLVTVRENDGRRTQGGTGSQGGGPWEWQPVLSHRSVASFKQDGDISCLLFFLGPWGGGLMAFIRTITALERTLSSPGGKDYFFLYHVTSAFMTK